MPAVWRVFYTCGSASFSTTASSTLRMAQRAMTIWFLAEPTASVTVVLEGDDGAVDAANGANAVARLKGIEHFLDLFLSFLRCGRIITK